MSAGAIPVAIRKAEVADVDFLYRMLVRAVFWRVPEPSDEPADLVEDPALGRYFRPWGETGDLAVIAALGDTTAGAAWFRLFPAQLPGYGFVRSDVPEVGIAVLPQFRKCGTGRALLLELQVRAVAQGYPGLSLSVHPENPAFHLYASCGFCPVGQDRQAVTMAWWSRR
jgi:ribosomal protein S18 acetylase RimI-like enzyme